jgi:hypothetical protein
MTRHYFGRAIATYHVSDLKGSIPYGPHAFIFPARYHEASTNPNYRDIGQGRCHLVMRDNRNHWEYDDIEVIPDWVSDKANIEIFWKTER